MLCSCLVGYCVQVNWLFQSMQDMEYISIINIIGRSVSTLLVFLMVKTSSDVYLYCLLYAIFPLTSGFLGLLLAIRKYHLSMIHLNASDIYREMRDGFFVFTTQLSAKVLISVGITLLAFFASNETVGIYSAIQKIPNILILM